MINIARGCGRGSILHISPSEACSKNMGTGIKKIGFANARRSLSDVAGLLAVGRIFANSVTKAETIVDPQKGSSSWI